MQRDLQSPHPRRPPAHLSVCLRHDGPFVPSNGTDADKLSSKRAAGGLNNSPSALSPIRKPSDESNNSGESSGGGNWFDRSNKRPAVSLAQRFVDSKFGPFIIPASLRYWGCITNPHFTTRRATVFPSQAQ
jgi:hypothetical protein